MTRERILELVGYVVFFFLAFFLFAYWTFPYQRLAAYIADKVSQSGSGFTLEIGAISPSWLTGVELEDVKVQRTAAATLATAPDAKDKAIVDQAVRVKNAHARIGVLSYLFGTTALSYSAQLEAGELEGTFEQDDESQHVVAKLERVDLAKLGVLHSLLSLPIKGTLSGDFDLTVAKQAANTSGDIKLRVQKLVAGDGKAKVKLGSMGGLTIDPVAVGDLDLDLNVKQGVGTVRKLSSTGPDLTIDGSGSVRFAQPLARSRLGLTLTLKLNESYRDKTPRTKVMFSLLEGASSPQVAAAKTADGAFQVRLTGALTNPRVFPAGQSQAGAADAAPLPGGGDDDE